MYSSSYLSEVINFYQLPAYENESVLRQKYLIEGLSASQLSVLFGCGKTKLKSRLRKFNIRKINPENSRHHANLRYGEKVVKGKVQEFKKESQVRKTIINMYVEEELSPTSIARILTQMKIPTHKQGKKWDHSVVISILKLEGIYISKRKSPKGESL